MTSEELRELIASDKPALELAIAGQDEACAKRCIEISAPTVRPMLLGELGILKLAADPVAAETILQTIEAIAEMNPLVKRVLKWLQPGAPGVDFGDSRVRAMLTAAVQDGGLGLTEEQASPLLRAAEVPAEISAADVSEAVAEWRVDGKARPGEWKGPK